MACNCATKEQIDELYRQFGEKKIKTKKVSFKAVLRYAAVVLCLIPIIPVLFIYVYYKAFCSDDGRISMVKFFHLKEDKAITNVG